MTDDTTKLTGDNDPTESEAPTERPALDRALDVIAVDSAATLCSHLVKVVENLATDRDSVSSHELFDAMLQKAASTMLAVQRDTVTTLFMQYLLDVGASDTFNPFEQETDVPPPPAGQSVGVPAPSRAVTRGPDGSVTLSRD